MEVPGPISHRHGHPDVLLHGAGDSPQHPVSLGSGSDISQYRYVIPGQYTREQALNSLVADRATLLRRPPPTAAQHLLGVGFALCNVRLVKRIDTQHSSRHGRGKLPPEHLAPQLTGALNRQLHRGVAAAR